jgi:uncharacterized iron-regulated membrane protein
MSASSSPSDGTNEVPDALYRAVWRWHFFAGVAVAPLLLVLATSGLVMLLRTPIQDTLYGHMLTVTPAASTQPPSVQLDAVRAAFPHMQPILFVRPAAADRSSEFSVVPAHRAGGDHGHGHGEATRSVFVDPYTARVLGSFDPARTPYGWANAIHGTLLMGDAGDAFVEIAAGLAVMLVGSGLYLARPRRTRWRTVLFPSASPDGRARTRGRHGAVGYWIALPLLFFLLSGLTWTGVWGGRVVQAWSTVSLERSPATMSAMHDHGDLNRSPLEEVPWALERTPLPESGSAAGVPGAGAAPDLDRVVAFATTVGFTHFRVALPRGDGGVWTVSASTLAGDVDAPADERFLHLDRETGRVLADVRYADYSFVGRFMASGVPFHQGELGAWNVAFNATICAAVIVLVTLSFLLSWQRRPRGALPSAPPHPDPRSRRRVLAGMFVCALLFPLSAAAIASVVVLDRLIIGFRAIASRQRLD